MLRATQTLNRRMVKRRNSPYASDDRTAKTNVPIDCTPAWCRPLMLQSKLANTNPNPQGCDQ